MQRKLQAGALSSSRELRARELGAGNWKLRTNEPPTNAPPYSSNASSTPSRSSGWSSLLVFLLIHLVPGDPILQMLGEGAPAADIAGHAPRLRTRSSPRPAIPQLLEGRSARRSWAIPPLQSERHQADRCNAIPTLCNSRWPRYWSRSALAFLPESAPPSAATNGTTARSA